MNANTYFDGRPFLVQCNTGKPFFFTTDDPNIYLMVVAVWRVKQFNKK